MGGEFPRGQIYTQVGAEGSYPTPPPPGKFSADRLLRLTIRAPCNLGGGDFRQTGTLNNLISHQCTNQVLSGIVIIAGMSPDRSSDLLSWFIDGGLGRRREDSSVGGEEGGTPHRRENIWLRKNRKKLMEIVSQKEGLGLR